MERHYHSSDDMDDQEELLAIGTDEPSSTYRATELGGGDGVESQQQHEHLARLDKLMDRVGTTRLQWKCAVILGLANAADAVEVLAIGYIVTVFKDPVSGKYIDEVPVWSSALTSAVFLGMLLGGLLSGTYGDRLGRKPLLTLSLGLNACAALVSSMTPLLPNAVQVPWLVFFRFFGGLGVGGSVPSAFSLGSEIGPSNTRSLFINVIACFWSVGVLYTSITAFIIFHGDGNDGRWPLFAALVSVPALAATVLCVRIMEESPRYLIAQDQDLLAKEVLVRCVRSDIGRRTPEEIQALEETIRTENLCGDDRRNIAVQPHSMFALLNRSTRRTTLLVCGVFYFLSFAHYGISSWISDLFKKVHFSDPYLTTLFYTAAAVPGLLAATLIVDKIGRRVTTSGSMVLACMSALLFSISSSKGFVLFSATLFSAFSACSWNALDVFSAESFPSTVRGSGLGLAAACGRIGSIMANVLNSILLADASTDSSSNVSHVLFFAGLSMLFGAACAFLLPETMSDNL